MRPYLKIIIFLALFARLLTAHGQEKSILSEGEWYKLTIDQHGVYKITYDFLKGMGIDPGRIDPRRISIYGNGGGMLPQANDAERPVDLIENRIWVEGESDGKFDPADYILFYAEGADKYWYNIAGTLTYQRNIYSNLNYYFLTINDHPGLRLLNSEDVGAGEAIITTFNHFEYFEEEAHNLLASGREWYSDKFDMISSRSYDFEFYQLAKDTEVKVTSAVMAQSFAPSTFSLTLNGKSLGEQTVPAVADFRKPVYRYRVKGREQLSHFYMGSELLSTLPLTINVSYEKNNSGRSVGFLNYLLIEGLCELKLYNDQLNFRALQSLSGSTATFEIRQTSPQVRIWDVSACVAPLNQIFSLEGNTASFSTTTDSLKEFVVFDITKIRPPEFTERVPNQNIRGRATPNLLIVTPPAFQQEAQRLANFRANHDNLSTAVVTTDQIYNEFSGGKQDVTAIRDYVKHLFEKGPGLRYLLLFGRGSYDYKDILQHNTNFVPIYESRNSLHPLETYASDDYYGFLENHEGEWPEINGGNHTLEIGIGRIPVTNEQSAREVVDKIIDYSTGKDALGPWRKEIFFVADDGDNNIHISQSDQLAVLVDTTFFNFNYNKLYLDAFPQVSTPNGERSPKIREAINASIDQGALVINFTGHGGELSWMQEQVLDVNMIGKWNNRDRLPLFVTATCEFSRHDDPAQISGGELVLTHPQGGGIAIISTCRPVFSSSNFELNKAFYQEIFKSTNGEYPRLGDVIRQTKNKSSDKAIDVNQVGNRNFALLGDPSLRLTYPEMKIEVTSINEQSNQSDTLKALGLVSIQGKITNLSGQKDLTFNGELQAIVYDKESRLATLGNESDSYTYLSRENAIFRGEASITDGAFTFSFRVPKNISYRPERGKISLYAIANSGMDDAGGANSEVMIGSTATEFPHDTKGPEIALYVGDSTYNGLSSISPNTLLVAKIEDENGVNVSEYGIGNNITAVLDGRETFVLNDYFTASRDTYRQGWVMFPLNDLSPGPHVLTLKAWDTYNNPGEQSISFTVSEAGRLDISKIIHYPNPFQYSTHLGFEHNRPGEDLVVDLQIISGTGEIIKARNFVISTSLTHVDLFEWDGTDEAGEKVRAGLYLCKITVRSLTDGAKNERYEKLILIN